MSTITVTLTAYNMGSVNELDYDCWLAFVCERIDQAVGFEVASVEQTPWGRPQPERDQVSGGTEEQREAVRAWLSHEGWDAFCGEEWESRRRALDAELAAVG